MNNEGDTEKRAHRRIPAEIGVEFYCLNNLCRGTVMNLSERGMFIRSKDMCLSFDPNIEIHLNIDGKSVHMSAHIMRIIMSPDSYDGIGIKIIDPPEHYIDFVNGPGAPPR